MEAGGLFARQGGKTYSKSRIIERFPPTSKYNTYVEPFLGGGSILLNVPIVEYMYAGDTDPLVVNTFNAFKKTSLKDIHNFDISIGDRDLYNQLKASNPTTPKRILFRTLYLKTNSYRGLMKGYFKYSGKTPNLTVVKRNAEKWKEQLAHVSIMKKDYKYMIKKYDSPTTFFYLDPPYHGTDTGEYKTGNIDHDELAIILKSIKGLFLLSHNDTPYIRKLYKGFNFFNLEVRQTLKTNKGEVKEVMIANYKL